jgi:hypothetical protein
MAHYIAVEDLKRQLNMDQDYIEDDVYLQFLCDAAENVVCDYLNINPCDLIHDCEANDCDTGKQKYHNRVEPIFHCMLMLAADMYNNRESNITGVSISKNPTFELLLALYKQY